MSKRILIAAASALLLAAPAAAQPRHYGFEEIATDLAYGFCPLFLAGQFRLDSPQLAERGFAKEVGRQAHPRFGELQMVGAKLPEGEIAFGGAPGKICTVVAGGDKRQAVLTKLRESMSWTGLDFKPVPNAGAKVPGVIVETFRAPVEAQALYVQLVQTSGATPSVMVQMFAMAQ